MAITSSIEWTDATWNPWQGCTKVSEACTWCYMFSDLRRYGRDPTIVRRSADPTFFLPLKKRRSGEYAIAPGSRVFTCSWSDWFHQAADAWRDQAWDIIRQRPDLIFQIVTKRTERIAECLPPDWGDGWPNVWLIATVENQHWADIRVPQLLKIPAAVRGLSIEPMLERILLHKQFARCECGKGHGFMMCPHYGGVAQMNAETGCVELKPLIHWVIAGGESGPHARPSHPDWFRSLRDQCQAAGVAFFFKQWGEFLPEDQMDQSSFDDASRRIPRSINHTWDDLVSFRVGKKAAGRLLDGREYSEFPVSASSAV